MNTLIASKVASLFVATIHAMYAGITNLIQICLLALHEMTVVMFPNIGFVVSKIVWSHKGYRVFA